MYYSNVTGPQSGGFEKTKYASGTPLVSIHPTIFHYIMVRNERVEKPLKKRYS